MGNRYDPASLIICDNCGLQETEHTVSGGTLVMKDGSYVCNHYSQRKLMTKIKWFKELSKGQLKNHDNHVAI